MTGSTVARVLNSIRAIVNFAANEVGVGKNAAFTSVYIDKKAGVKTREPVPDAPLNRIKSQCRELDDERRWLVALLADTGMRLSEAAGIRRTDIVLKGPVPHVHLVPHTGRPLKTEGSRRKVPLVGASLWAAERILAHSSPSPFAFPCYNKGGVNNANSASAALNKRLKCQSASKRDP